MSAVSLWGSEAFAFNVKTKHGPARISAHHFHGHQILILARPHEIQLVDQQGTVRLPEGVAFIQNKDLGRRTEWRVTHQIVTDGIYDLFRSLTHVARGEKREVSEMHEMRQLTFDFIGAMRAWGVLSEEERETAIALFAAMGEELDAPKRNGRKLTAGERYRKAASLKTSTGKVAPMPAAFTASAGAHHLGKRSREARAIADFFVPRRVELYACIMKVHAVMDDVWRLFQEESLSTAFNPIGLAATRPRGTTKRVAREKIKQVAEELKLIRVRPYIELIDGLLSRLRQLYRAIERFVPSAKEPVLDLAPFAEPIRSILRTMRLVRIIEMELVMPLAFLQRRWKRWNAERRAKVIDIFKHNFAKTKEMLDELSEDLLLEGAYEPARRAFTNLEAVSFSSEDTKEARKDVRDAKKLLKELVRDLS